jgi:hypothetical protein
MEILIGIRPALLEAVARASTAASSSAKLVLLLGSIDSPRLISLEAVTEDRRLTGAEVDAQFGAASSRIFGALLDGLVAALKNLPTIEMTEKPRMADLVLFAEAGTLVRSMFPDALGDRHKSKYKLLAAVRCNALRG